MSCIKHMLSVLMDSIKDTNMIMDYVEEAEENGKQMWAEWFKHQAKKRMDNLDSVYDYVVEEIGLAEKVKNQDEIAIALHEHLKKQMEEVKKRYEVLR